MKNYKNYIIESNKTELTLGKKLFNAYEDDDEKLIEKLIGYDKEADFNYILEYNQDWDYDKDGDFRQLLNKIEMYCDYEEFGDYANLEVGYIGAYVDMMSYGYEYIIEIDELNYKFDEENTKLLKKIYSMFDFKFEENEYEDFFRLTTPVIEEFRNEMKVQIEWAYEESHKSSAFKIYNKFYDAGFEIGLQRIDRKNFSLKIDLIIKELNKGNDFKSILEDYLSDLQDFEALTYSGIIDSENEKLNKELKSTLNKFINKYEVDKNDFINIISENIEKDYENLKDLGGRLFDNIKSDEWQENYIDKLKDGADERYKFLKEKNIITNNIKKKYAYLIARKKFKL